MSLPSHIQDTMRTRNSWLWYWCLRPTWCCESVIPFPGRVSLTFHWHRPRLQSSPTSSLHWTTGRPAPRCHPSPSVSGLPSCLLTNMDHMLTVWTSDMLKLKMVIFLLISEKKCEISKNYFHLNSQTCSFISWMGYTYMATLLAFWWDSGFIVYLSARIYVTDSNHVKCGEIVVLQIFKNGLQGPSCKVEWSREKK